MLEDFVEAHVENAAAKKLQTDLCYSNWSKQYSVKDFIKQGFKRT